MTTTTMDRLALVQYEALLIQLAQAMRAGDQQQSNQVRRAMELPERELDDTMMDRFDGLSADLYMLEGKEYFEYIDPTQAIPDRLGKELREAWDSEKWERVLVLLRKSGAFLSQEQRAYLRAIAYENLGQLRSAFVFMDYAAHQNPADVVYSYNCLDYLLRLGEDAEAINRAYAYVADQTTPPALLIKASAILIQMALRMAVTTGANPIYSALVALVRALASKTGLDGFPDEVIALGYVSLGFCLELLGDTEQGSIAYRLALVVDPRNDAAQEALRKHLASRKTSTRSGITVPRDASTAVATNTSFQTIKAQQIWFATGSD